jgi:hypothetical protein
MKGYDDEYRSPSSKVLKYICGPLRLAFTVGRVTAANREHRHRGDKEGDVVMGFCTSLSLAPFGG